MQAVRLLRKALATSDSALGNMQLNTSEDAWAGLSRESDAHPLQIEVWKSFAYLYGGIGRYDKAHEIYSFCFRCSKGLPAEHADVESKLGWVDMRRGCHKQALEHYVNSLKMSSVIYGRPPADLDSVESIVEYAGSVAHPSICATISNLAELMLSAGSTKELQDVTLDPVHMLSDVYSLQLKMYGNTHVEIGYTLKLQAEALKISGQYHLAKEKLVRSHRMIQKVLGEEHVRTAGVEIALAQLLVQMGERTDAIPLLDHCIDVFSGTPHGEHSKLTDSKQPIDLHNSIEIKRNLKISSDGLKISEPHPSLSICRNLRASIIA